MTHFLVRVLWLAVAWIELAAFTLLLYLLAFLPRAWLARFYFPLFRFWCRSFVRALGVDLRLHQKNARPLPAQFILIANHPSAFEDIGVPALFRVHSLAKHEVGHWWIVGRITRAAGTLYVRRESRASRRAAVERMTAMLEGGHRIALYPEGGCKGRRLSAFRFGAFEVSLRTGVPIVPLFLHYEAQEDFQWQPHQSLVRKLWDFMTAVNNRANYYVFDAVDPRAFEDKKAFHDHVYGLYLQWQARYLE